MNRLVEVGTWQSIAADVSPQLTPDMRTFQQDIRRNGIDRVSKTGVLRHDCPEAPSVEAGKDCYVFVIAGQQVVPVAGVRKLRARLRLWPAYEDGAWQVINYDYDLLTR